MRSLSTVYARTGPSSDLQVTSYRYLYRYRPYPYFYGSHPLPGGCRVACALDTRSDFSTIFQAFYKPKTLPGRCPDPPHESKRLLDPLAPQETLFLLKTLNPLRDPKLRKPPITSRHHLGRTTNTW